MRVFVEDEEIETTPTHPFWVIGKGWVAAGDMEVGDKVYLYSGEGREIKELKFEHLDSPIKVYNFEVEDWHTYFVSEQDVFVHNSCGGNNLIDGENMTTNQALSGADDFLGAGYQEVAPGVFRSKDGLRQIRMTNSDITGAHGGGPHMNFEIGKSITNPNGRVTFKVTDNIQIYLTD